MLTFVKVESPAQLLEVINKFDPHSSTWIVADLKSKIDIQNKMLQKYGYYLDDSILRISDFWQIFLRRLGPNTKVVSESYLQIELEIFFESIEGQKLIESMNLEAHQYSTLYKYMKELAPLILSPQSDLIMQEWQEQNNVTWYSWYLISRVCLNYLIYDKKIILNEWISCWLQGYSNQSIKWNKTLFFDLGTEMTSVEMSIVQQLSKSCEVNVFVPNPIWKNKYKYLLNTYQQNEGYSQVHQAIQENPIKSKQNNLNTYRFDTEALEVKFISFQLKKWLTQGVKPHQILIASPRLEQYWDILKIHLDFEQISFNKKVVSNSLSTGVFQLLISKILSHSESISWETIEQDYFNSNHQSLKFEYFRSQFFEIIDPEDLLTDEQIKNIYYKKINFSEKVNRQTFLAFLFKEFLEVQSSVKSTSDKDEVNQFFIKVLKDFISSTNENFFKFQSWFKIFLNLIKRQEILIKDANESGIEVTPIQSSVIFDITHVIWFGLDDSGFKQSQSNLLPIDDIEKLKFNFDFPMVYPEESHIEFNLRWLSQFPFHEQIMTCSLFNMQADPLMVSSFFLESELNSQQDKVSEKGISQLDQFQNIFSEYPSHKNHNKVYRENKFQPIVVDQFLISNLSMTDFNQFDHCAFKLLATKGFKLKDYPTKGLDLDPRQSGSIYHSLFEFILQSENYKSPDEDAISNFLELIRQKNKIYINNDFFWSALKKKLILTAVKFSKTECERLKGQSLKHLLEVQFKLQVSQIEINGRIDRIDVLDSTSALIFDYKRSNNSSITNGLEWINKKELQMLFYLLAASESLNLKPEGALYYFYKNLKINKGLVNESLVDRYGLTEVSNKALSNESEINELIDSFKKYLLELELKLLKKDFTPQPFKVEICQDCNWKDLCRAPHL